MRQFCFCFLGKRDEVFASHPEKYISSLCKSIRHFGRLVATVTLQECHRYATIQVF